MSAGYDIGASASTSSGAQSGQTGDFNVTGGGEGSPLPKLPAKQAWIAYVVLGVVILIGLALWFRRGK